jgi:hypothetical protein
LWEQTKALWQTDKIVIVNGKVDVRNGRAGVLADSVRDYVEGVKVVEDKSSAAYRFRQGEMPARPEMRERTVPRYTAAPAPARPVFSAGSSPDYGGDDDQQVYDEASPFANDEPEWLNEDAGGPWEPAGPAAPSPARSQTPGQRPPGAPAQGQPPGQVNETAPAPRPVVTPRSEPAKPATASSAMGAAAQPIPVTNHAPAAGRATGPGTASPVGGAYAAAPGGSGARTQLPGSGPAQPLHGAAPFTPQSIAGLPVGPGPTMPPSVTPPSVMAPPAWRKLCITFRRCGSLETDRRRLADLVSALERYPGDDRFEIIVEAPNGPRYQLDFPNNRTRLCSQLESDLTERVGAGNWRAE